MKRSEIEKIVDQLTLEEKAGLCSGLDNWVTKPVERLGVPSIRTSDGPHGLRIEEKDEKGFTRSQTATCFPPACASAASFDPQLLREMGTALGKQCQANNVQVLLGPGVNIKRSPLCGRNFEYFSEDPLLAGELGSAFVKGVQEEGVGTSLKHFFANSQEHRRMNSSSEMDERTMREIYLPAFEKVVKEAKPWTIMASYNQINGTYATENREYLEGILRNEWGYEGAVVSDWGATHDRTAAVAAGTDLTMPAALETDAELVQAFEEGRLSEEEINRACIHVLELAYRGTEAHREQGEIDYEADHQLARKIAEESLILLKNDHDILPLKKGSKIAFIGDFAQKPRYQGGGSSHVSSYRVKGAVECAVSYGDIIFARGYEAQQLEPDERLIEEAVKVAKNAEAAVIFAGLPEVMESEGYDRAHMRMPESHNVLIQKVCAVQPNTVVVLHNGSPVEVPWAELPAGIIEAYLGGEAVGEAVVEVLFGEVNPSGRLPETFPMRLQDNPSYLNYTGEDGMVYYGERMFVGYRYYESKDVNVRWPFGYGLSYTDFEYTNLNIEKEQISDQETLQVQMTVSNTGNRSGKTVVQLYVAPPQKEGLRPVRELRKFEKVFLNPGESRQITFSLDRRDFAYWRTAANDWDVEEGTYAIEIGASSHDILLRKNVKVFRSTRAEVGKITMISTMGEFLAYPTGARYWEKNCGKLFEGVARMGLVPKEMISGMERLTASPGKLPEGMSMLLSQPVNILCTFIEDLPEAELKGMLEEINQKREEV